MKIYLVLLFASIGCVDKQSKEFATVEVAKSNVEITISLTGRAEAAKQTTVMAPDDLTVEDLLVNSGQKVQSGDVLCRLDNSKILEQIKLEYGKIDQVLSQKTANRIRLAGLKKDFERTSRLLKQGAASLEEKEKTEQEVKILESQLLVHEKELKALNDNIEKLKKQSEHLNIKAPFEGVITFLWTPKDNFIKGSSVKKGDLLIKISSEGKMMVKATIKEQDITFFHQGQKIPLLIPALANQKVEGTITMVDNAATIDKESEVGTFRLYIEFTPPREMKSGMEVIVEHIAESRNDVLTIPKTALNPFSSKGYEVMIIEGDKKVKKSIQVGLIGDLNLEIVSGLTLGQKVMAQYEE
jgi:RND family efflux transporter MFP subunit